MCGWFRLETTQLLPLVMATLLFTSGCVQLEETTLSLDLNNGIGDFQG